MRFLLFAFVCVLSGVRCQAVEFTIESPTRVEIWPKSSIVQRSLRWYEKKQILVAEITYSNALYSGDGDTVDTETYTFVIPGVAYDAQQKLFFVQAPNGDKVAIAQRTKVLFGSRIDLCRTATIHLSRISNQLALSLVVNSSPGEESPVPKPGETKDVPLDSLINH